MFSESGELDENAGHFAVLKVSSYVYLHSMDGLVSQFQIKFIRRTVPHATT